MEKDFMQNIINFFFEGLMLKDLPRSGYAFLGSGHENVAEHAFVITLIAYAMGQLHPGVDRERLLAMCLLHDIPEARTGDLNYVNKTYVEADEKGAIADLASNVPFGSQVTGLLKEFREKTTLESQLANDADQLAFLLNLKRLHDTGKRGPQKWMDTVCTRLGTDLGRKLAEALLQTEWDAWWQEAYTEK